ncbi:ribose 5-phosphate isomerase B [Cetobacterium sp. SF1]|uniref:ribose 5-phosphate isomerase B n=1 Tax=unclassified Cetobacterium TaxID=2630983 RepID=UPI003CF29B62
MKIVLGADHGGYQLKEVIKKYLTEKGYEVLDKGTYSTDSVDYPDYAKAVAQSILNKEADYGVLVCGTGLGISIAANRYKGIRAALCNNTTMAKLTREHNNANILALGGRTTGDVLALDILDTFLNTEFQGGRHQNRIDKMDI